MRSSIWAFFGIWLFASCATSTSARVVAGQPPPTNTKGPAETLTASLVQADDDEGEFLAIDARYVYWRGRTSPIKRVPKRGGPSEALPTGAPVGHVALDDSGLYWTDSRGLHVLRPGALTAEIVPTPGVIPVGLALDDDFVYAGAFRRVQAFSKTGAIEDAPSWNVGVELSRPEVLKARGVHDGNVVATSGPSTLWIADSGARSLRLVSTERDVSGVAVARDGATYFSDPKNRALWRVAGREHPRQILGGLERPGPVAVCGNEVCVGAPQALLCADITQSTKRQLAIDAAFQIACDDEAVYVSGSAGISRISRKLWAETSAVPFTAPESPAKPNASDIVVTLAAQKPAYLRCVRNYERRMLVSAYFATIKNISNHPVTFIDLGLQGLVFEDATNDSKHIVVHSCECMDLLAAPMRKAVKLMPGAESQIQLAGEHTHDGGPFPAPGPGRYHVRYRTVLVADPVASEGQFFRFAEESACQKRLEELLADESSAYSDALDVMLPERGPKGCAR